MGILDTLIVIVVIILLILYMFLGKNKQESKQGYFIVGRGLLWPVIGISIIAANISSEHFIGMAGSGYKIGLAIASHEWTAAIALVIISLYILPKYMSVGVKTIPEYLEYRFNKWVRLIIAIIIIFFTVFIQFASVIYAGSLAISTIFEIDYRWVVIIISLSAGIFTVYGGLSAVVRSNVVFAVIFLAGGILITGLGIQKIGGFADFANRSGDKLTSLLPLSDEHMPWITVFFGGLWVAQFYYFGFNQFITQYLLSGKTLSDAQKGILFGASLKVLIPFIIVVPGIIAFEIFGDQFKDPDLAYPSLVKYLAKDLNGLMGIILCTLFAAVISSVNSMLIAASQIFTYDIYKLFLNKDASDESLTKIGRLVTVSLIIIGCFWAPFIGIFHGSFEYMQKFAGMISPGVLLVFLLAMFSKRVPAKAAMLAIILNIPIYLCCLYIFPNISFYDNMGITFIILLLIVIFIRLVAPLKKAVIMPEKQEIKFERSLLVVIWSIFLVTIIAMLYLSFL
jgi:SSS family solute:Na+ symporter